MYEEHVIVVVYVKKADVVIVVLSKCFSPGCVLCAVCCMLCAVCCMLYAVCCVLLLLLLSWVVNEWVSE